MVITVLTKSTFASSVKDEFNDKTGTVFHYSHTPLKNMVFGNVPVLYTLAWMFYKRDII